MNVDFEKIEEKRFEHFKGGEGTMVARMYVDDSIRILKGYLEPGATIGMHAHEGSSETVYILGGTGKMLYDDTEEPLKAGSCSYCPEGHKHSLVNTGNEPLWFIGVVPNL